MSADTHEPEDEFAPGVRRSAQEVARRCIILTCLCASLEFSPGYFNGWLQREGLWEDVSPRERKLLLSEKPGRREVIQASWRSEALQVLLWAIGKISAMSPLNKQVRPGKFLPVLPGPDSDTREFLASSVLRPEKEIDAELGRMIHAHWQIRNEQLHPDQKAPEMIPGVVMERHTALEWVVNLNDEPWDEVTTNT